MCLCVLAGATFHSCITDTSQIAVLQRRREEAYLKLADVVKNWEFLEEAGFQLSIKCEPSSIL